MELTLKDRVIVLNTVLPQFDTRKGMTLKVSISNKLSISEADQKRIIIQDLGSGQFNIGFTDADAITRTSDIPLTPDELAYLKDRIDFIDRNGMFSEFTLPTYTKISDTPEVTAEDSGADSGDVDSVGAGSSYDANSSGDADSSGDAGSESVVSGDADSSCDVNSSDADSGNAIPVIAT